MTRWAITAAVVIEGLSEYAKTAFAATENERTVMTMAEYIERGALEIDLNGRLDFLGDLNGIDDHYTMGFFEAVIRAKEFPSADVAPVRHGRWIEQEKYTFGTMYDCSICGDRILDNGHYNGHSWNYCPNCGAKMDEVSE